MRADQQRVRSLLAEAITILCKNCLAYKANFCVEGLLGITLDDDEVFLVNIKENVRDSGQPGQTMPDVSLNPELALVHQVSARAGRPVPTSRPIPSQSPFVPHRTGYRTRGRPRGSRLRSWSNTGRRYVARPPSRQPYPTDMNIPNNDEPPTKRIHSDSNEDSVLEHENSKLNASNTQDMPGADSQSMKEKHSETNGSTQNTGDKNHQEGAVSNTNDPLVSLDFGDMLQQYEDSGGQQTATQEDSDEQDQDCKQEEDQDNEKSTEDSSKVEEDDVQIVIKPDPEGQSEVPEAGGSMSQDSEYSQQGLLPGHDSQSGALFGTPVHPSDMFGGVPSGSVFPSQGSGMMMGGFVDSGSLSASTWGQPPPMPSGPSPRKTGPRRGPGRPPASAAAGSPAQKSGAGNSPQVQKKVSCPLCSQKCRDGWVLKRHMSLVHSDGDPHLCVLCLKTLRQRQSLKKHMIEVHKQDPSSAEHLARSCPRVTQGTHSKSHNASNEEKR